MKKVLKAIGNVASIAGIIVTLPIAIPAFFIIHAFRKNRSGDAPI